MKEYFIYQDGAEQGPFSLQDLEAKGVSSHTMLRHSGTDQWLPAHQIDELTAIISKDNSRQGTGSVRSSSPGRGLFSSGNRTLLIVIAVIVALVLGTVGYFVSRQRETANKERIRAIHEQEVQKAILELQQEKIAKKRSEAERKELLKKRNEELQLLNTQLNQALARRSDAYDKLEDINRPRLFRSRRKKETQLDEQQSVISSLNSKISSLQAKVDACNKEIEELSKALR